MRIALAGSGDLATTLLHVLWETHHQVVGVVQNGRITPPWKRRVLSLAASLLPASPDTAVCALRRGLPIVYIDRMSEAELAPLADLEPDLLLVAGFSLILKRPVLDLPRIGCVNCHSSLLPRHRGPNPFHAAIVSGDRESGVTFHTMTEGIDDGDILAQYRFPLTDQDTALSVFRRAVRLAAQRLPQVMRRIEAEGLVGTPQDHALATYEPRPTDTALRIRWNTSAGHIERQVRAGHPFSPAWFDCARRRVTLEAVEPAAGREGAAPGTVLAMDPRPVIATGDGAVRIVRATVGTHLPRLWPGPRDWVQVGDILL